MSYRDSRVPALERANFLRVCFVVRAGYRKHGLMHHLQAGAVQHATVHGAEIVEGYPVGH